MNWILNRRDSRCFSHLALLGNLLLFLLALSPLAHSAVLRVVSVAPSWSHTVAEIGAIDTLVGVSRYAKVPAEIPKRIENGTLKTVGGFSDIQLENILALKPDLVLTASTLQQQLHEQLLKRGVASIHMDEKNIQGIFSKFRQLGEKLNRRDSAESMITRINNAVEMVKKDVAGKPHTKVYYELNYYYKCVPGRDSPITELMKLAGAEPIFSERDGNSPLVSWQEVIEANPDVILVPTWPNASPPVFTGSDKGSGTTTLEEIYARPEAEKINAIKHGRVWFIDSAITKQPGPFMSDAVKLFAETIHRQP